MKKYRFFLIISIIIIAIIFSTAAICNQCSIASSKETAASSTEKTSEDNTASGNTQAQKSTEADTAPENTAKQEELSFTFDPKSGPEGTEVYVYFETLGVDRIDSNELVEHHSKDYIKITLSAGATTFLYPSMIIDASHYFYPIWESGPDGVYCQIYLDEDPTPLNNRFTIEIQ